jgi:flagellin
MTAINVNLQAITAARNLNQNQELLGQALNRLSSGSKIISPADDAAGLAVSGKLDAQNLRVQAAATNVQNAVSYAQTADGFMSGMTGILSRLGELGVLAHDPTKNASDVALYQSEFKALQDQLRATIGGSTAEIGGTTGVTTPLGSFNGITLFGSTAGLNVTIGSSAGQDINIPNSNLRNGAVLALINQDAGGNYLLQSTDPTVTSTVTSANLQVATQRATLGAVESRLNLAASTLTVEGENLTSTISQIRDTDVAKESTAYAKYNILVQAGTAMLAQANQDPKSVLTLLQR